MGMLGTYIVPSNKIYPDSTVVGDLPKDFDARTNWPGLVHPIRDQQSCGSCWAFGATEAFSDRFAISSKGAVNVVLSPEDMVSCDHNDYGCSGGYMDMAWEYLAQHGVVSDACFPYTAGSGRAPACRSTCVNGEAFKKYTCAPNSIKQSKSVESIKSELLNGPVEAAFTVYEDFFNYAGGVYHHVSGGVAGGHAIKVLGWGVDNGTEYFLCANSWGTSWGEKGFFRIQVGDSGINDQVFSCTPQL